ncbi:hypothetical protein, partial [Burkholderia pseudomallei]|uniref:hypothetical protein n=1 Tax=Burkholderia pseudomallei TaxID=28450 RepID=UPI001E5A18A2
MRRPRATPLARRGEPPKPNPAGRAKACRGRSAGRRTICPPGAPPALASLLDDRLRFLDEIGRKRHALLGG